MFLSEKIPHVPALLLSEHGTLKPLKQAIDLLGSVVVPGSSLIVGARLYAHLSKVSTIPEIELHSHVRG